MDRPRSRRLLALCFTLLLAYVSAERCREERYLPNTLSAFPELSRAHELHLHGDFRANLTRSHQIVFDIVEPSYMRIYLAPEDVDIDLYLFKGEGDAKQQIVRLSFLFTSPTAVFCGKYASVLREHAHSLRRPVNLRIIRPFPLFIVFVGLLYQFIQGRTPR